MRRRYRTRTALLYHRYLTPAQVQERFGPTARQIAALRSLLTAAGLRVTDVTAHYVAVSGTAAQAQRAFGAAWHSYRVDGTTQQSPPPGAELTAPALVAAAILTVAPVQTGLPGYTSPPASASVPGKAQSSTSPAAAPSSPATAKPPCSSYYGQSLATSLPPAYGAPPRTGAVATPPSRCVPPTVSRPA